jgi:hypothetical protein
MAGKRLEVQVAVAVPVAAAKQTLSKTAPGSRSGQERRQDPSACGGSLAPRPLPQLMLWLTSDTRR